MLSANAKPTFLVTGRASIAAGIEIILWLLQRVTSPAPSCTSIAFSTVPISEGAPILSLGVKAVFMGTCALVCVINCSNFSWWFSYSVSLIVAESTLSILLLKRWSYADPLLQGYSGWGVFYFPSLLSCGSSVALPDLQPICSQCKWRSKWIRRASKAIPVGREVFLVQWSIRKLNQISQGISIISWRSQDKEDDAAIYLSFAARSPSTLIFETWSAGAQVISIRIIFSNTSIRRVNDWE